MGEQKAAVVPGALRVSHTRPATSTFGAGDLGVASVVHPAVTLAGGKSGHWRVRSREWYAVLSGQASSVLRVCSTWKDVGYAPFISVSCPVPLAGGSR